VADRETGTWQRLFAERIGDYRNAPVARR